MRKTTLLLLLAAVGVFLFSCAGWPWNKHLPRQPQGVDTVRLYAIIIPRETFDLIDKEGVSYEQAASMWLKGPSVTFFFKEVCYKRKKADPAPPADAVKIQPAGAQYPVSITGLSMRRFEDKGLVVLCGEGRIYYGKSLIEVSPMAIAVNGKSIDMPNFFVHARETLDSSRDKYDTVPNVVDITVGSDGRWREGVENVSP
jgi:hypothetical protein